MKPGTKDHILHGSTDMKSTRPGDVVHRQSWPSWPWIESPETLELGGSLGRLGMQREEKGRRENKQSR